MKEWTDLKRIYATVSAKNFSKQFSNTFKSLKLKPTVFKIVT